MLYDVQVWKRPGVVTDTVTTSKRYAIERADTVQSQRKYHRVIVMNRHGDVVHQSFDS